MAILKGHVFNGFGFPVSFRELPAVEYNGKLYPQVDWKMVGDQVFRHILSSQRTPLTGYQIKGLRTHLNLSLRSFAQLIGVTHPSVMGWEDMGDSSAKIESHTEVFLRVKCLIILGTGEKEITHTFEVIDVNELKKTSNKKPSLLEVERFIQKGLNLTLHFAKA